MAPPQASAITPRAVIRIAVYATVLSEINPRGKIAWTDRRLFESLYLGPRLSALPALLNFFEHIAKYRKGGENYL